MSSKKITRVSISFTADEIDFLAWLVSEVIGPGYSSDVKTVVADKVAKAAEFFSTITDTAEETFSDVSDALAKLEEWCPTGWPENCEIEGLRLVCTCPACPEQYDVFDGNKKVGYLRLRHGKFRADYPHHGGETVYRADTKGDGVFLDDERQQELTNAVKALKQRIEKNAVSRGAAKGSGMGSRQADHPEQ
jgi:hypothetical protein